MFEFVDDLKKLIKLLLKTPGIILAFIALLRKVLHLLEKIEEKEKTAGGLE